MELSKISYENLDFVRRKFMMENDWNLEVLSVLLFSKQRNSSIVTICSKLENGHMIELDSIRGKNVMKFIFPMIYISTDLTIKNDEYSENTLEKLLSYCNDKEKTNYILSFISESRQEFPVYDYPEHKAATFEFFNEMRKIIIKGSFCSDIIFQEDGYIAKLSLFLLYEICQELAKREGRNIEELFWDHLVNRHNIVNDSNMTENLDEDSFVFKSKTSDFSLLILDEPDVQVARDFFILDGCICELVDTQKKALRKREDPDRKEIDQRLLVSIFDSTCLSKSLETKNDIISKSCKDTVKKILKH